MTENPQAPDLPRLSVAVQVTRVVPRGKGVPDAGAHVVETGATPPVGPACRSHNRAAVPRRASACTSAGHVTAGAGTGRVGTCRRPPAPGQAASPEQSRAGGGGRCRHESVEYVWFCHRSRAGRPAAGARSDGTAGLRSYTIASGLPCSGRHAPLRTAAVAAMRGGAAARRTYCVAREPRRCCAPLRRCRPTSPGFSRRPPASTSCNRAATSYSIGAAIRCTAWTPALTTATKIVQVGQESGRIIQPVAFAVVLGGAASSSRTRRSAGSAFSGSGWRAPGSEASSCPGGWKHACNTAAWC